MDVTAIIGVIAVVALIGFKFTQNARRLKEKNDRAYLKSIRSTTKTTDE
jgi:hypothetical protein